MQFTDDRHHLRVEIRTQNCELPPDQRARMQGGFTQLGEAVADFPSADLQLKCIFHRHSNDYHVEARLRLPGDTLFTGDFDAFLDSAFQRCVRKLVQRVEAYRANPNRPADEVAERRAALNRDVVAPQAPEAGGLSRAVGEGNYKTFRTALSNYEDWIRLRVGRWVQRYPEAQARVGKDLKIGDLVEEVYLNAFEGFTRRPAEVPLHDWLNSLIDPSLKALMRHPAEEAENASMARTLRETPLS